MVFISIVLSSLLTYAQHAPITATAADVSRKECGKRKTGKEHWDYCIYRYANASDKVVYFFHGINGNERDWEKSEKVFLNRWTATHRQPPTVVSISFGKSWFLAEKNSSKLSGLYELFAFQILPEIQTQLLGFVASQNILLGYSMGGLNASQLYFKMPLVFTRAAIICGAMATITPFATKQEIKDYLQRTGADEWHILLALALSRSYFPTLDDWNKHSPVTLAQVLFSPLSAPLYVSNGLQDEFGFHEGNIAFAELAATAGVSVQSHFYATGDHCGVDPLPIADFIVDGSRTD